MSDRPYLSIGEVLGLLLEEFPDITISKIRFLESQGLIEPERTASGYRKFYDADVERLRFILREQRENYLPLKVIKDRLGDTPAGGLPRGIRNVQVDGGHTNGTTAAGEPVTEVEPDAVADGGSEPVPDPATTVVAEASADGADPVPATVTRSHPSARASAVVADLVEAPVAAPVEAPVVESAAPRVPVAAVATPTVSRQGGIDDTGTLARVLATHVTRAELLESSGVDGSTLDELESYGLVSPRTLGQQTVYEPSAVVVAEVAAAFVALGIEVRHLKTWRTAAEREAGLFEQRITPLLRQRNPQAREQSLAILDELVRLGGRLRGVMVEQALRQYIDPH